VNAKVGPVKATFDAHVEIADAVAPERYTLKGEGKGGVAGFAKGSADVELAEDGPDTTVLTYHAKATIGGKLAQLGSRLVDNTARKYASEFFATLSERVSGPAQEQPAEAPAEGAAPAQAEEAAEAPTQPAPATTPAGAGAAEGEATRPQPAPDAERTPESRTSPTTMLVLAVIIVALAAVAVYALI
jgi:cell division septation protein DedD